MNFFLSLLAVAADNSTGAGTGPTSFSPTDADVEYTSIASGCFLFAILVGICVIKLSRKYNCCSRDIENS
jgi:hypothetical protein